MNMVTNIKRTILGAITALAATTGMASDNPDMAKKLGEMYPSTKITSVSATEIDGLYEVVMGKNIGYTDKNGRLFVFGHIFDMQKQQDLTQQRLDSLNAVNFSELPLKDAIKVVQGKGGRVLAVFSDPDCPYCKRLEPELAKLNNVTIYTFLYPLTGLHPEAGRKAELIWCAKDKAAAWQKFMATGELPSSNSCPTPIERNSQLGQSMNINGTPTLIAADGRIMPGASSAAQIDDWLNKGGAK